MKLFRKTLSRELATITLLSLLFQLGLPLRGLSLTGGASNVSSSGSPTGSTEMVDLFTGDFKYNVPLFEVPGPNGGYPISLNYNSNINMEQEASWVGLGWSLTPGGISRSLNGLPDEFDGDKISIQQHVKDHISFGINAGLTAEIANLPLTADVGKSIYYDNYFGVGMSTSVGVKIGQTSDSEASPSLGLGISFDARDGVSGDVTLSASKEKEMGKKGANHAGTASIGLHFSSAEGLSGISLGVEVDKMKGKEVYSSNSASAYISTVGGKFNPQSSMVTSTKAASFVVKGGASFLAVFGGGYAGGFFDINRLNGKYRNYTSKGYGLFNLHNYNYNDSYSQMDFKREHESVYTKDSKNLSIPRLGQDNFYVSAAGIGGSFRAYRNEIGSVETPTTYSDVIVGSIGFDAGVLHGGLNGGGGYGYSQNKKWNVLNEYSYKKPSDASIDYEPYYLKMSGEMTAFKASKLDYIGEDKVGRFKIEEGNFKRNRTVENTLVGNLNSQVVANSSTLDNRSFRNERRKRATAIQFFKNNEVSNVLPEYNIKHHVLNTTTNQSLQETYPRTGTSSAGYTMTNSVGVRYNFAQPVYSLKHTSATFSSDQTFVAQEGTPGGSSYSSSLTLKDNLGGSEDYKGVEVPKFSHGQTAKILNRTTLPKYATSYLVTSILGQDYVDVTQDGPSLDDQGYWTKFEYTKIDQNYKWRAPFSQAMFYEGQDKSDVKDNTSSYQYGEKEQYYMKKVETKTHVAIFQISPRKDARGANNEFQDGNSMEAESYKLDRIDLYTQEEYAKTTARIPLKSVHFKYSYDLCQGVPNNNNSSASGDPSIINNGANNGGKLTLKEVYFTYRNNTRGELNPYEFDYHENDNTSTGENPNYLEFMTDKWGNYNFDPENNVFFSGSSAEVIEYNNQLHNYKYPYVNQDKEARDVQTAVWSLKKIELPSGATLDVEYEADDYAYVQDKKAMKMFKILGFEQNNGDVHPNKIEHNKTKVYFELENPFPESEMEQMKELYRGDVQDLAFNIDIVLKEHDSVENPTPLSQVVRAWAELDDIGFDVDDGECYRGWIKLKHENVKGENYHPMSFAAWQYMDLKMNSYVRQQRRDEFNSSNASDNRKIAAAESLLPMFSQIGQLFRGYYARAKNRNWSKYVYSDRSFIRLYSPKMKKLGGGHRVKQIVFNDQWETQSGEENAVYGQVYDYTTTDELGRAISSGVAAYEPLAGGEENPIRRVKNQTLKRKLKFNQDLEYEYPMNESYYPAPVVGYSKVRVKSLATHYSDVEDDDTTPENEDPHHIPEGILTSGAMDYEFYTAKDFPVISEETLIDKPSPYKLTVPLILYNTVTSRYFASQGYQITVNDMHGKLRKVSYLERKQNGEYSGANSPYVEYKYKKKEKSIYDGFEPRKVNVLDNEVDVLTGVLNSNGNGAELNDGNSTKYYMGVEWDVALDNKQSITRNSNTTISGGVDGIIIPFPPIAFPLPGFWPSFTYVEQMLSTSSFNKVFYRHGILEETISYDGQATITSRNEVYDPLSGQVVLSTVDNQYDQTLYEYNRPAHLSYEGMGSAVENLGMEFTGTFLEEIESRHIDSEGNINTTNIPYLEKQIEVSEIDESAKGKLFVGDELIASKQDGSIVCKYTVIDKLANGNVLMSVFLDFEGYSIWTGTLGTSLNFLVTRSGKRNLISAADQSITAKTNPLEGYDVDICSVQFDAIEQSEKKRGVYIEGLLYDQDKINDYLEQLYQAATKFPGRHYIPEESKIYDLEICGGNQAIWTERYDNLAALSLSAVGDYAGISHTRRSDDVGSGGGVGPTTLNNANEPIPFRDLLTNHQITRFGNVRLLGYGCIDEDFNVDGFVVNAFYDLNDGNGEQMHPVNLLAYYKHVSKFVFQDYQIETKTGSEDEIFNSVSNNILSISATPFTDICHQENQTTALNPFRSGLKGIWKSSESYAYVQDQEQEKTNEGEIDVKNSGHMNNVTHFNPDNPFMGICSPNWRKVSEVTRYNGDGAQLENKDILGVYSSAVIKDQTQQPLVISGNAKESEITFVSFEGEENNQDGTFSNITPLKDYSCEFVTLEGDGNKAIVPLPYDPDWGDQEREYILSGASLSEYSNKSIYGRYTCIQHQLFDGNTPSETESVIEIIDDRFTFTGYWSGLLKSCESETVYANPDGETQGFSISTEKAHTGKSSLKLSYLNTGTSSTDTKGILEVPNIKLENNKEYVIDAWTAINVYGKTFSTYGEGRTSINSNSINNGPSIELGLVLENDQVTWITSEIKPTGNIIDGWQRISSSFTVPNNVTIKHVLLRFESIYVVVPPSHGRGTVYYDDIRICPKNAEMVSYVYDDFHQITAQLDNRNFATFYHYNDQGELYLTRTETEKGIKSLSFSTSHIAKK